MDMGLNTDAIENAYDFVGDDSTKTPFTEKITAENDDENIEVEVLNTPKEEVAMPTRDANLEAIREDPFAILKVAKRAQTDDEVLAAVIDDGSGKKRPKLTDKGIAKARSNTYVYQRLLEKNPWRLNEVPEKKINRALVKTAIVNSAGHPEVLREVPERFRTKPVYIEAVEVEPLALEYVPDDIKTRKMCTSAVERDFHAIQWVPKGLINAKTRKAAEKELKLEQLKAEEESRLAREAEEKAKAEAEAAKAAKQELATADDLEGVVIGDALAEEEAKEQDLAESETLTVPVSDSDEVSMTISVKTRKRINPLTLHFSMVHEG